MPLIAVVTFLVLYCFVSLGMVRLVERTKNIEFDKPSVMRGIIYSAILPFVLAALFIFLIVLGFSHGPMHDSL